MKIKSICWLFFAAVLCCGADEVRFERPRWGGNGMRSNMRSGERRPGMIQMQSQVFAEAEIAEKFPAEFAEVEAMREKYEAALAELAKKSEVTLPESRDNLYRKLRKNHQSEFLTAVRKMKESPREGMAMLMALAEKDGVELFRMTGGVSRVKGTQTPSVAPGSMSNRNISTPDLGALRRKYPDKMREYDALRRKNPAAAREILMKIIETDRGAGK